VRLLDRVPPGAGGWRLVAARADLGARPDGESAAAVAVSRPLLGDRQVTSNAASDVGRRIVLLRQRLGLSQAAFARRADISRNSLVDYERGDAALYGSIQVLGSITLAPSNGSDQKCVLERAVGRRQDLNVEVAVGELRRDAVQRRHRHDTHPVATH
jgi:DNA-binding transcriptional regulator YiaG